MRIAAGIISILYGILIASGGGKTKFFVVWLIIGGLLCLFHFMDPFEIMQKIPVLFRHVLYGLALIGVVLFLVIEARVISCFNMNGIDDLDYVIVLGSYVKPDGPSRALKYRLDQAYAYLNDNPKTICIVSGGQGSDEVISEAECMKEYLCEMGIDENRIIEEDRSGNTVENIRYSMEYMDDVINSTVGIITNDFHVFRATHIAKKQGLNNVYGISAHSTPLYVINNAFREFFAVVKDLIKGNMTWR